MLWRLCFVKFNMTENLKIFLSKLQRIRIFDLKNCFFIKCLVNESPSDWFWSLFFVIRYGLQFRTSHLSWYAWCLLRQKRLVKSTIQFSRCIFGGQKRRIKLALRLDFNPPRKTSLWNEFSVSLYLIFLPSNLILTPK